MRHSKRVFALVGLALAASCNQRSWYDGPNTNPDTGPNPGIAACNGICVNTAPAPFTGPSEFWIGPPGAAPACPSYMNVQGVQGPITAPQPMTDSYARECRVESAGACLSASLKCVPFPAEDYHVCIHHADDRSCPDDYPYHWAMLQDSTGDPVTMCCTSGFAPG